MPGAKGNFANTLAPSTAADASAWRWRSGGTGTCSSGTRISPLASSSIRESSRRRMRKLEGTTPLASPEWTPSVSTSTRSVPVSMPRSEVVTQSCS
jgi:hypothetical protein